MLGILSKTWWILLLPLFAVAVFLGVYFYFYRGDYEAPTTPHIPLEQISSPSSLFTTFSEVLTLQKGLLVVDAAHRNDFLEGELSALVSRVKDRGYQVEFLGEPGQSGGVQNLRLSERLPLLREKLRQADSLAVILPGNPYEQPEVELVKRFVKRGGKLLLVGDPTRQHRINSLAQGFGISFQADYLYNSKEYDLNFQNIYIRDFRPHPLTAGLAQIVLYTAGSIRSDSPGIAFTDGNTRSSMVERVEPFFPIVEQADGLVLAISDLTFMIPPQNAILDNDRLISNLADYLTESRREFDLADFPHFFKQETDILLGRSDFFDLGIDLKSTLSDFRITSDLVGVENITRDTVFLGTYDSAADVVQYLDIAGVQVDDSLRTPFGPDISAQGTAIILLHRTQDRHVLVVLGESQGALINAVFRLRSGEFRARLVNEVLGVYD